MPAFAPGAVVSLPLFMLADIFTRLGELFMLDGHMAVVVGVRILGIWLLAWIAIRIVGVIATRLERAMDDGDDHVVSSREKRGRTLSQLLRSVGRIFVVIVALLLTINLFINIGPLLAGAGILGLAISFGAQSLVKDVISGFFILFENQFALGDVIEAGGKSGVVEKMTLRVVVLRDLDGSLHIVPNGEIKTVSNRTQGWSRAVVDVAVAYNEDADRAMAVVLDEARRMANDEEWAALLDGVPEVWGVESVTDSAVMIRMVARTQPGSHWGVSREFRRRIKARLQAEGIANPLQKRQVQVQVEQIDGSAVSDTAAAAAAGAAAG